MRGNATIVPIHAGAAATERERFAKAFQALEGEVCDLTRMARLAELQLYEAVGELSFAGGEYTETPKVEATELAVFAVSQMADMAKRFEELYYRLHNEAAQAQVVDRAA
jgi:hypothetical protein